MEPNQANDDQAKAQPAAPEAKKGYGKRPMWQWVLLYVVVAAILYYVIYLLFFHHGASAPSGGYGY